MDLPNVSIRGGFSDRYGIKPENTEIQLYDFDDRTRTLMANCMNNIINVCFAGNGRTEPTQTFVRKIRMNVYSLDVDFSADYRLSNVVAMITNTIKNSSYDSVLSVIEYVCRTIGEALNSQQPFILFNHVFEREYVGYRFVNGWVTPITGDIEIKAIEKASNNSPQQVKEHFEKALKLLSDRVAPDYENSIKESISAVEAECNLIYGKKGTLGDTLSKLEKEHKANIHPSLRSAFDKLYGYTSDGKGIRHAGTIGGPDATFAEAEFMIIACSAFVNYLRCNMAE